MSARPVLATLPNHIAQKVKIAGQRTLSLSVHEDEAPADIVANVEHQDCVRWLDLR
jgi:hypothetical protein